MHPFSILTFAIFVAGYITARWDLITQLYQLAIFAWDHGVVVGSARSLGLEKKVGSAKSNDRPALQKDSRSSLSSSSSSSYLASSLQHGRLSWCEPLPSRIGPD